MDEGNRRWILWLYPLLTMYKKREASASDACVFVAAHLWQDNTLPLGWGRGKTSETTLSIVCMMEGVRVTVFGLVIVNPLGPVQRDCSASVRCRQGPPGPTKRKSHTGTLPLEHFGPVVWRTKSPWLAGSSRTHSKDTLTGSLLCVRLFIHCGLS